jgi:hypothetical protein
LIDPSPILLEHGALPKIDTSLPKLEPSFIMIHPVPFFLQVIYMGVEPQPNNMG